MQIIGLLIIVMYIILHINNNSKVFNSCNYFIHYCWIVGVVLTNCLSFMYKLIYINKTKFCQLRPDLMSTVCVAKKLRFFWVGNLSHCSGAVLEILLSSFQAACLSRMRTVGSLRRVSSDATTQTFAKVSNFPSWRPKKKKDLHCISLTKRWNKGQLTPLFSPLFMPRETL